VMTRAQGSEGWRKAGAIKPPLHLPNQHSSLLPPTTTPSSTRRRRFRYRDPLDISATTAIMKLITAALLSAVTCYTELAAAATGHVLTSLSTPRQLAHYKRHTTLSPETARLVIAQRAGSEDYHVEKALSEEETNAINAYGSEASMRYKGDGKHIFVLAFVEESEAEGILACKAVS
jgi:hypothetical protein